MKWLKFAAQNALRNRRRSLVTVIIAGVATASVLVGGGFALFTYEGLKEVAARDSGHIIVAHKDYFDKEEDTPLQFGLSNPQALRRQMEQNPSVRIALPRLRFTGLISNGDKSTIYVGMGVDPSGEFIARGPFLSVTRGNTLSTRPKADDLPEVMLGTELARLLKADVGSVLTVLGTTTEGSLNALDVRVQGLYSVGVPDLDRRSLIVSLPTAQSLLRSDRVSELSLYLKRTDDTPTVLVELQPLIQGFAVRTWRDQAFFYEAVRQLYNRIFGMLGVVIALLVFFAVSNTVSLSVVERTREIGTLRAMGTLPREIVRNFLLEAGVLGASGIVVGMLLATGISVLLMVLDVQMPPPPGRSTTYPLRIEFSWLLYGITAASMLFVSIASAWVSCRDAARTSIVKALTHV